MPHACEQERGEAVGGTVGYSVRLDTRACAATRLLYCTTGVTQLRSAFVTHVAGAGQGCFAVTLGKVESCALKFTYLIKHMGILPA